MVGAQNLSQKLSAGLPSSCSQAPPCSRSSPSRGSVLVEGQGLGPATLKLLEKVLIREGAAVDDGVKDEVQRCYHATDEEERQERLEVFQALLRRDAHEARGVRNRPQLQERLVREQQGNGSVQREGDTDSRGW